MRAGPVLLAGQSRSGFLSTLYAGQHPAAVAGVLNFVGGWTAETCHASFEAAGGRAALHVLSGIPGDGHRLAAFPDRWSDLAAAYVRGLG